MLNKERKQLISFLTSPEVVLNNGPSDVIKVPKEVFLFVRNLYNTKIVEVHKNYYVNPKFCNTVTDRAWVIKRRTPAHMVACVQTATWIYTGNNFEKLVLNHKKITCITENICITDHGLFKEDVIEINNLLITSPARTLIDMIRYEKKLSPYDLSFFKNLSGIYEITYDSLMNCLDRMRDFKRIDRVHDVLCRYGFLPEL